MKIQPWLKVSHVTKDCSESGRKMCNTMIYFFSLCRKFRPRYQEITKIVRKNNFSCEMKSVISLQNFLFWLTLLFPILP